MKHGGALIGEGADTCVYDPIVACVPGTQTPAEIPPGRYVSRVVNKDIVNGDSEVTLQAEVAKVLKRIHEKYPDQEIEKYFNVAVATCEPSFKGSDLYWYSQDPETILYCEANNNIIDHTGPYPDKVNLITRRQDEDLQYSRRLKTEILPALRKLFHAVAYLNNEDVVHADAHFANVAWMGGRLVLHDWGRVAIGVDAFKKFMYYIRDYKMNNPHEKWDICEYPQFILPCKMLKQYPLDNETRSRFMKFYDVVAMAGAAGKKQLLSVVYVAQLREALDTLLDDRSVPTDQMMPAIHKAIDDMFDAQQRFDEAYEDDQPQAAYVSPGGRRRTRRRKKQTRKRFFYG